LAFTKPLKETTNEEGFLRQQAHAKARWRQKGRKEVLNFSADTGAGRYLLTPRYCFMAQNAFYGLKLNVLRV
jgi:hypothetical protein